MDLMNYSAKLNEYGQKKHVKVQYEEKSRGPDHQKTFTAQAVVNGKRYPEGVGKTKKEAKENAALKALGMLQHRDSSGFSTLPTKISQINYQSWLNEHGQKNRVTYKPVESREGTVNAQFCCNYISDDGKSYPVAYGKSKQEAKEKAAKLAYEVLKTEKIYCTSSPNLNQGLRQTSSLECFRHSTSPGPSCHPARTSIANPAGGRDRGSSLTPAFPAPVFSHSSHLAGGKSASKPIPTELNFFNKHKAELEWRLSSTTLVLNRLESCSILNAVERETVEAEKISTSRNHALIVMLSRKGEQAQERFYEILKETDPYLVEDLEK